MEARNFAPNAGDLVDYSLSNSGDCDEQHVQICERRLREGLDPHAALKCRADTTNCRPQAEDIWARGLVGVL